MRKQIIAGNWKMNNNSQQTQLLLQQIVAQLPQTKASIMVAPAFTNLQAAVAQLQTTPIQVAAQNMHAAKNGAYTGEVSADMLQSIGVDTVILGHSERRAYFKESNKVIREKLHAALQANFTVILCCGEELLDRKSKNHFKVVKKQLKKALINVTDFSNIVIAYEPVWAIGTGETASSAQAQEMHQFIRKFLTKLASKEVADTVSILYGGSVKPDNAKELFSKADVDGGLIGGAALNAEDFIAIIKAMA